MGRSFQIASRERQVGRGYDVRQALLQSPTSRLVDSPRCLGRNFHLFLHPQPS